MTHNTILTIMLHLTQIDPPLYPNLQTISQFDPRVLFEIQFASIQPFYPYLGVKGIAL